MISMIAAVARNGVIGGGNSMLWHITEDLRRFKAITMGHPVIMGRKTYQSLGRALPGRTNIIVTRNSDFSADGCLTARSLSEAVEMAGESDEIFIIGGGEIYREAMPLADRIYLTVVEADYDGDTTFPTIGPTEWTVVNRERFPYGEKYPHPFEFIDYMRKQ